MNVNHTRRAPDFQPLSRSCRRCLTRKNGVERERNSSSRISRPPRELLSILRIRRPYTRTAIPFPINYSGTVPRTNDDYGWTTFYPVVFHRQEGEGRNKRYESISCDHVCPSIRLSTRIHLSLILGTQVIAWRDDA